MKKYQFRLEQVRRVRRTQQDSAKAALQVANAGVHQAAQTVEDSLAAYQQMAAQAGGIVNAESFMQRRYFDELAGQALAAARRAHQAAEEEADAKRAEWSVAASKVKVLDRLDERRRAEYDVEYGREVEREVDDIVTGRFGRIAAGDTQ